MGILYKHQLYIVDIMSERKNRKKVSFQTSVDPTVEAEAMKTFLVFESGESGDLSFNEFQQAVVEMGFDKDTKEVNYKEG